MGGVRRRGLVALVIGSCTMVAMVPVCTTSRAQTPAEIEKARKAYEDHMRRMDDAEKAAAAKPAPPLSASPAKQAASSPPAVQVSIADQDAATERGLEQYRRMMKQDPWSNPALLDADRGEALWTAKKGPQNASLAETCNLGKGVGTVDGAFAELPRYFEDADRVQDVETRILWCMERFQDFNST